MTIACMGGKCQIRENCVRYTIEGPARLSAGERLCKPALTNNYVPSGVRFWFQVLPVKETA